MMNRQYIRPFESSDLKRVASLIHQTIEESYAPFYSDPIIKFFKEFHSENTILRRVELGNVWVTESEGLIVGTGTAVGNEVYGVFVSPASQRKGIGRLIMNHLETQLYRAGYEQSELSISLPSREFYEFMGYSVIEEVNREVVPGHNLRFWKAAKKLS